LPERPREKKNKAASGKEKLDLQKMKFTGTMIEDLMATVERAEQRAETGGALPVGISAVEPMFAESLLVEPPLESSLVETWFVSVRENADYDSKFMGVA